MKSNSQKEKANRFRCVCDYLINQSDAKNYRDLGVMFGYEVYSSFYHMIAGMVPISKKMIEKLKTFSPQINVDWILTGEGEMLQKKRNDGESQVEIRKVDRFVTFLYSENIQIKVALEQLKWTRRAYDKALREDLTLQQLADIEAAYPRVNMEWVLSGKGAMLKQEEVISIRTIKKLQAEVEALKAKVNRLEKYIKKRIGEK